MVKLPNWKQIYFGNVAFQRNSKEMYEVIEAFIPQREASLKTLFELKEKIGF